MASPTEETSPNSKVFVLGETSELRFDVPYNEVTVKLRSGYAEIFGAPLEEDKEYTFEGGMRVAVYSWPGATIELIGPTCTAFIAENGPTVLELLPMIHYGKTIYELEQARKKAVADKTGKTRGPRTMVVGPPDVGKSTLCRILANYAVLSQHRPIFVDVDVGQGNISVAGTIGAVVVDRVADPVDGFDCRNAKIFQFGSTSPGANIPFYKHLVGELADMVDNDCAENPDLNSSGVIINTCGWVHGAGYRSLRHVAKCFRIDVMVVLCTELERSYTDLKRHVPNYVKTVYLPKSNGVQARNSSMRAESRRMSIHKYFYGTRQLSLAPFLKIIPFDDLVLAKIGTDRSHGLWLPHGMKTNSRKMVVRLEHSPKFKNHVVAIVPPQYTMVDETLLSARAIGFIVIKDVYVKERQIRIMCPQGCSQGPTIGLLAETTFIDDSRALR
uniref:Protein CLP1 homolog n=1 Tax=Steinernema glaseri TaxID=37863 RepID=A0A1I7Y089_9BILA